MEHKGEMKLGILGCANIARTHVNAVLKFVSSDVKIYAIASRSLAKAQAFASANKVPKETKLYGSYEELLDDEGVDAVYIPLPTGLHLEWVVKAAEKRKHVMLDKPPAMSVADLDAMLEALNRYGLQYMDGTFWVHHPRTAAMHKVIHDKEGFGKVCEVHSTLNYDAETSFQSIGGLSKDVRGQPHLDGLGALGDTGWYCAGGILWAFDYEMPSTVMAHPGASYNEQGVLISCGATFVWPAKKSEWATQESPAPRPTRTATFSVSFNCSLVIKLLVCATKGSLEVSDFNIPNKADKASFLVTSQPAWDDLFTGWSAPRKVHEVVVEVPQEALMIRKFAQLVSGIRDGTGKVDPRWAEISRKTQVLLGAVKESLDNGLVCVTI